MSKFVGVALCALVGLGVGGAVHAAQNPPPTLPPCPAGVTSSQCQPTQVSPPTSGRQAPPSTTRPADSGKGPENPGRTGKPGEVK